MLVKAKRLEDEGRRIIHFDVGEPDFDTPKNIKEAAKRALDANFTHYLPPQGLKELREAIAEDEKKTKGLAVSPDEVIVTPGAKPMIFYAILAFVDPDDEVIYPDPGYTSYRSMIRLAGGRPVPIELREDEDFALDIRRLERLISAKTKAIIINTPHNPTGSILTIKDLEGLAAIADKYDLMVISDEVYSKLIYEGEHVSIATLPKMRERTIVVDGFSKTYAMTGWRLGYGIVPQQLVPKIVKIVTETVSCATAFVQKAGVEALKSAQNDAENMRKRFKNRRDLAISILSESKYIKVKKPKGAFYIFPNIKALKVSSYEFTDYLLENFGVSVVPGPAFGIYGEGYFRISYATSEDLIEEGVRKIVQAAEEIASKGGI